MPINPNIALAVKAPEIQIPNALAQAAQIAQLRNYDIQAQEAQAALEERNRLRALNPAAADYEAQLFRVNPQLGIAYRKERTASEASEAARQKSLVEAASAKQGMLGQAMRDISQRPSDANITAHLEDVLASPLFSKEEKASVQARSDMLLGMPFADRGTFLASQGAKAGELAPKISTQNTGKVTQLLSTPAFGGAATVVPGSTQAMQPTPGELLTDARARERLQAEMATGQLTPESLDVAANVYLQTGQLPTGLGKAAAGLRSQVMNRATELSGGKPAADVAGDIVGAKLDVASRGKAVKDFSTGTQGRQVNAFNTAIDHLDTMDKLSDALQNSDVKAINAIGNTVARQTGAPAPTNFDAAKQIVTAEVIKAVVASGGGVTERQEAERNFAAASSPAQLKGVIDTYKKLLGGQLNSLGLQYANTTGRKDFETKLTPAAKTEFQRIRGEEQPTKAAPRALAPADQQALDWANANPKDPRAAQIKQRLGL